MGSKLMNWLLVLVVLIGTVAPVGRTATAAGDKTGILTNLSAVIIQNGKVITQADKINGKEPIEVIVSFGVPVAGDDPVPPEIVEYGDTASILLSQGFSALPESIPPLKFGSKQLADASLSQAGNTVTADVYFNGDADIFDGIGGYYDVSGEFTAKLQYDDSGSAGSEGDHTVMILGKTYTVNIPPAEIVYNIGKSGTVDLSNRTVEWQVDISATQSGNSLDLKDYIFSDNLAGVGELVAGSFKMGGTPVTPDPITGNVIQYTFSDNSVSPQTVTFQTKIPENKYYANNNQSIGNTAELLKDNVTVKEGSTTVTFTPPKSIEKSGDKSDETPGGIYDPSNRTITWTITANRAMADLENLTIKDQLPNGLDFVSAKWETSTDGSTWTHYSDVSSEPINSEYTLSGTTSDMARLIITSKVTDTDITTGTTTFYNSATLDWDGKPAGVNPSTGSIGVGIGYNAITKSGTLDKANREITWTVNVDAKGQSIPGMKVYDLLVYKNSIDLDAVTGLPPGINKTDLTPRHGLKYVTGSYTGDGILNAIAIEQGGEHVADLLEITNLSTSTANRFSFKTLVVDPDIFAGNKPSNVSNTASLFDGIKKLNAATGTVNYDSRTLEKELLKHEAQADPAAGVNIQRTVNAAEGFDYTDKSVIFRLSINADGLDFDAVKNADDEALGAVTVTDALPAGWEFTEIAPGQNYLVFEGTAGSGSSVNAVDITPDPVAGLTADFTETGKATFTFSPLNKPYVILVKAKPNESTLDGYFNRNQTTNITNNLQLLAEKWTPGVSRNQNVSIKSEILKKSYSVPQQGTLNWTVDYNPYALTNIGERIEDTLPIGLDLRTDSKGVLLLDSNITATELTLKENGTLEEGNPVVLVLDGNISYDNATRVLTFIIPDSSKAYRFTYVTDITGEPGSVTNQVRLSKGNVNAENQAVNYAISNADSLATMQRGGWLEITKTNGATAAALSDAEFTLFSEDGSTVIRKAVSAANGKLTLRAIPAGQYVLKETAAPFGYTLDDTAHTVSVDTSGPSVVTSIDGKIGTGSNLLAVANYLENTAGNLAISKTVAGNDGDLNKRFDFTVTFTGAGGTYSYIGTGGASHGTISSGDTIALAHGEGIIITGLPKDAEYTVTETDYSPEGYITTSIDAAGIITADDTQSAAFTNTKDKPGSLVISKTVAGNAGDQNKKFDFTVQFSASGEYEYFGNGGAADGRIKSGDTVSLAHGESIAIAGLPKDTTYSVTEADYAAEGYAQSSQGDTGIILTDSVWTASFVNTKNIYVPSEPGPGPSVPDDSVGLGSLSIAKSVAGDDGDRGKRFNFSIILNGAAGFYSFTGSGGASHGSIQSGGSFSLAHGESITISGLPEGTNYVVTEEDYSGEGYATSSAGASGVIQSGVTHRAAFINTKDTASHEEPTNGDDGDLDGNDGEGLPDGEPAGEDSIGGDSDVATPVGYQSGEGNNNNEGATKGTPKTGDTSFQQAAKFGFIFFLLALAALFLTDSILRSRRYPKNEINP
ncbi:DUF7601 domain-containing protein [Paenibacillus brevis]|uniref:Prealbumin-like fold domain-containing protein n=1 Tax=Paenibacillus brevis TaxID=2841508 RepID=A0ABS6FWS8_9BACL|nr:DUF5979 domain-containing protein [Paenibacillus brevis]MBU5674538.1 hypothetical protein [Paenibacillus brevis]